MVADSLILPQCEFRPGSFTGLMLLYESNFMKFQNLAGSLSDDGRHWISRVRGDNELHLDALRREPYTTTLCMSYWLRGPDGVEIKDPDLTIRVYHDAGQVEAVACRVRHHHRLLCEIAQAHSAELGRRWRINMMLNKWLDYLADCGHGFA